MKVLYFCATGASDPTRASLPFHLAANGSVEEGQDTALVIGGDAGELVKQDLAESVEGVGLPPLKDLLAKLRDHEVPVYV